MKSLESIIFTISSLKSELRKAGVAKLWLYGSAARGEPNFNDLDFLVEFDSLPSLTGFMDLKYLLEDRLQMPVDILTLSSCPDRFMRRIQPDLLHVA